MSQTKAQLISDLVQALNFTGTASAPANGLFLSAANTLKLATASTERLKIDGTEVVVNDTGANVDFRVEGDTEANLLFVDAGADKVGIGTAGPNRKFEVHDTAATVVALNSTNTSGTTLRIQNSGTDKMFLGLAGDFIVGQTSNVTDSAIRASAALLFATSGGGEKMRLDTSGRLIVGDTSSASSTAMLQTKRANNNTILISNSDSTATNFTAVDFAPANSTVGSRIVSKAIGTFGSSASQTADLFFETIHEGTSEKRLYIDSTGLVGIGTDAPDNVLHIESSSNTYLQIEKTGTSSKVYLGNSGGEAILESTGAAIKLKPNGRSNDFILNTSGYLGLGKDPQRLLEIAQDSTATYNSTAQVGGSNINLRINNSNGTDNTGVNNHIGLEFTVSSGATSYGQIGLVRTGNNTGDFFYKTRTGASSFAERFRILNGGGITFNGDTAADNALDDYEEGEYTPALSNGQTLNSSYDKLRYTRIGRQVSITGQLVFSTYNSSDFSSTLTIGLPFNNGNGSDRSEYLFHAGIGYFNPSGSSSPSSGYQPIGFYAAANSSHVSVFAIDPNTDVTVGNWVGSGTDIWVNLTYFTDA